MKNLYKGILFLAIIAVMAPACKKYEDGPSFSLRTKKGRLTGTWTMTSWTQNGNSLNLSGITYTFMFDKDENLTVTYTTSAGTSTTQGSWQFEDKKEKLITTLNGSKTEFTIKQLENDALKLFHDGSSIDEELTFKQ